MGGWGGGGNGINKEGRETDTQLRIRGQELCE